MSALAVRSTRVARDRGRSAPEWDITLLEQASATAEVRWGWLERPERPDGGNDDAAGAGRGREIDLPQWGVTVLVGDEGPEDGSDDRTDDALGAAGERHGGCFTTVSCLGDRRVRVRSCSAPPALLVGRSGAELVPSAPCSAGGTVVDDEHRLLVLSAAAYETLPRALVTLLREFPSRFLRTDPVTLLETIFADIPVGSAALISPVATTTPADRRNRQEPR